MPRSTATATAAATAAAGLWRSVIAIVVVVWALALAGSGLVRPVSDAAAAPHPQHALLASLGGEFAVNIDHPHLGSGPLICSSPKAFGFAVLPQSSKFISVVLGLLAGGLAVAGLLGPLGIWAGWGPHSALAAAGTGQDLLTRFCLSRR
jgi:lipoprotein LpqS